MIPAVDAHETKSNAPGRSPSGDAMGKVRSDDLARFGFVA